MKIALAQYPITEFSSFIQWKGHMADWVQSAAKAQGHLLVFPEYGAMELASLFNLEIRQDIHAQIAALTALTDDFISHFCDLAKKLNVIIVAPSFPVQEKGVFLNRAFVCSPKGLAGYQDKLFMTRFEKESWDIRPGVGKLIVFEADWGTFGIQICYDIEFAIGAHLLCHEGASLIIGPSCTDTQHGAARVHLGARARAMENQCFTAVSQTIGDALWSPAVDVNFGYAGVYGPLDTGFPANGILNEGPTQQPGWQIVDLDFALLGRVRQEGQVKNFEDNHLVSMAWNNQEINIEKILI